MNISKKSIDEFKRIFKDNYGKELSDDEAQEAAQSLLGLFDILIKIDMEEQRRKRRLKLEPKGFHLTDGTYTCHICHCQVTGDESWYDKWGIKCRLCQKAINKGIVPGFVCRENDSRYLLWELKGKFGIHSATAKKLVRQGKLKARIITYDNEMPYEYVFLKKENPRLIDPDRYSPARKSYNRHRDKITKKRVLEEKMKSMLTKQL